MKYGTKDTQNMWPIDHRKLLDLYGQPLDFINSPFAFPRLPPRANPPLGISNASKIKENIVKDSEMMMSRLSEHHVAFQRYAAGLFNMTPNRFMPGHPMHSRMQAIETMEEENHRLKNENTTKTSKDKEKAK